MKINITKSMKNDTNPANMLYPLEQQEKPPKTIASQDEKEDSSSQASPNSSSSSLSGSSRRVNMAGGIIHTGSVCSRDTSISTTDDNEDDGADFGDDDVVFVDFPEDSNQLAPHPRRHHKQEKRVSFDSIDIREYARCLQVHPETIKGPPIGIDWKYQEVGTFDLEKFEIQQKNCNHLPRRRWRLLMPANIREALLIESGATEEEMKAVVAEVRKHQQQRRESFESQDLESWFLLKETCKRRFRRWKTGVSKQREQELLWETAAVRLAELRGETPQVATASRAA